MQVIIRSKNLEVNEHLRALVEGKLGKLNRYLENLTKVDVELSYEKTRSAEDRLHVGVSLLADGSPLLRAEARGADVRSVLDEVADVVQRRAVRHKERLQGRGKVSAAKTAAAIVAAAMEGSAGADALAAPAIETQSIEMKPLTVDDALDEMLLGGSPLGRDLFLFVNADTGQANVLQRRPDGGFTVYVPSPG